MIPANRSPYIYMCRYVFLSLEMLEDFKAASDNNTATAQVIHEEIRLKITRKLLCVFTSKTIFTRLFTKSLNVRRHAHTDTHAHAFCIHVERSLFGSRESRVYVAMESKRSEEGVVINCV